MQHCRSLRNCAFAGTGSSPGRIQDWGGDGLVPAFRQRHVVFWGRAVPAPAHSLSGTRPEEVPIQSQMIREIHPSKTKKASPNLLTTKPPVGSGNDILSGFVIMMTA